MDAFEVIGEVMKESSKKGALHVGQSRGYVLNDSTVILHMAEGKELKVKATLDDPRMHEGNLTDEAIAEILSVAKADTNWEDGDEEIHVFDDAMVALELDAKNFTVSVFHTVPERLDMSLDMTA